MTTPTLDDVDKQFREMFAEGLSRIAMPETPEQYAREQEPVEPINFAERRGA